MKDFAFCDSSLPFEVRVKYLIDRMTLEEKVRQMGDQAFGVDRIGLLKYEWWSEALHGVSDVGNWNSKGSFFDDDVPGATSFPTPIHTTASFNVSLWKRIGQSRTAKESSGRRGGMADSIAMTGGEGPYSYFRNSNIQAQGSEQAKLKLIRVIEELLELQKDSKIFSIADLGCSVGPNTFSCVKTIIEAVQNKYRNCFHELKLLPEFHVFFNDHVCNDFNTLFKALPSDGQYMAAGVPGSFHGRLFPKSSINLMHSAFALQWLTRVPEEVTKEDSPLWNKGRITYGRSSSEIAEAFRAQFFRDMEAFFNAQSVELAPGGLLLIFMPCRPEGNLPSDCFVLHHFECVGDALADMVKEGLINESLADSFNVPFFFPTASEMKQLVSSNKHLSTQRLEIFPRPPNLYTPEGIELSKLHVRAIVGDILSKNLGPSLVNEIFHRFPEKLKNFSKSPLHNRVGRWERLFLVVKRSEIS